MENILLEEALNESTPLERLLELVNSGEEDVFSPVSLLEKLSTDPFLHTRIAVARNLDTPDSLLEKLQLDNDKSVRRVAAKCLQIRRNVI